MTELGKERVAACSFTSSEVNLFCTMNWARSPTILLLGVTWLWLEDSAPQYKHHSVHLDNVTEEQVGLPVFLLHHLKLVAQSQAVGITLRHGHRLSYFGEEL